MKVTVKRFLKEPSQEALQEHFEVDDAYKEQTLLALLTHIKRTIDPSLTFSSGCRSSVCGSCAVRVNGVEQLACAYKPQANDLIEPLRHLTLIRDLVVSFEVVADKLKQTKAYSDAISSEGMSSDNLLQIEKQSDCILCSACYSACPVLAVDQGFLGPFALTKAWRYTTDSRVIEHKPIIDAVQKQGIWDCTLCNECVPVCPQGIAPKQDISMLQTKSGMLGYMNPNFGGGMDFGTPIF